MLTEDQANEEMESIETMADFPSIWAGVLQQLYEEHQLRDYKLFDHLAVVCHDDWGLYSNLRMMNYGY